MQEEMYQGSHLFPSQPNKDNPSRDINPDDYSSLVSNPNEIIVVPIEENKASLSRSSSVSETLEKKRFGLRRDSYEIKANIPQYKYYDFTTGSTNLEAYANNQNDYEHKVITDPHVQQKDLQLFNKELKELREEKFKKDEEELKKNLQRKERERRQNQRRQFHENGDPVLPGEGRRQGDRMFAEQMVDENSDGDEESNDQQRRDQNNILAQMYGNRREQQADREPLLGAENGEQPRRRFVFWQDNQDGTVNFLCMQNVNKQMLLMLLSTAILIGIILAFIFVS